MRKYFIFYHGFGFDKDFWANLSPYFFNEYCIYPDSGYFGNKLEFNMKSDNVQLIGIGHSLGLIKLLNLNKKFDFLIGLNSFINFLGSNQDLHRQRALELKALKKSFIASPSETLKNFYSKCGASVAIQKIAQINKEIALNDLQSLSNIFDIPKEIPTLILGTNDDIIVPPMILYDNFRNSNISIDIIDSGKHALGFHKADVVYQKIMSFINHAT